MIEVKKYKVENTRIKVGGLDMSIEEAGLLYDELGKVLGRPKIEHRGCNERYSHGPHVVSVNNELHYCRGRRFDAT
jgi:hypothetical protein